MSILLWRYFTDKAITAKPLDCKFSNAGKQEVLTKLIILLRQVKSYIDPTKDDFTQPLSIKEVLEELKLLRMFVIKSLLQNDYYRASSTSQGQTAFWAAFEKTTNSCFA